MEVISKGLPFGQGCLRISISSKMDLIAPFLQMGKLRPERRRPLTAPHRVANPEVAGWDPGADSHPLPSRGEEGSAPSSRQLAGPRAAEGLGRRGAHARICPSCPLSLTLPAAHPDVRPAFSLFQAQGSWGPVRPAKLHSWRGLQAGRAGRRGPGRAGAPGGGPWQGAAAPGQHPVHLEGGSPCSMLL